MAPRSPLSDAAARRGPFSSRRDRQGFPGRPRRAITTLLLSSSLLLTGCQRGPSPETERIDQLELKIQQLEQRLNKAVARPDPADKGGKPPAGPVKSLTLRTGTDDDRLRIYWGDGSSTDLPCTREQATYVCG